MGATSPDSGGDGSGGLTHSYATAPIADIRGRVPCPSLPNYDPQLKARLQAESVTPLAVPAARIGGRPRPASAAGVRGTRPHSRPGLYNHSAYSTPHARLLPGLWAG